MRRRPKGWIPARAMPLQHRVFDDPYTQGGGPDAGENVLETSTRLDVVWQVTIPGQAPYEFHEVRKSPMWATPNELGVPCLVDPEDRHRLWVDWDAAYEEHLPVWERISAVEREVAKRTSAWDSAFTRVFDPFARKIRPEEEHLVEQAIAAEKAEHDRQHAEALAKHEEMQKAAGTWASPEEHARFDEINAELTRVYETGTPCQATLVQLVKTEEKVANIPVFHFHLDVHDTDPPRRLVHVQVMGDNRFFLRKYKPGKVLEVRIDQQDPNKVAIAG
jgi:hypothetical protein